MLRNIVPKFSLAILFLAAMVAMAMVPPSQTEPASTLAEAPERAPAPGEELLEAEDGDVPDALPFGDVLWTMSCNDCFSDTDCEACCLDGGGCVGGSCECNSTGPGPSPGPSPGPGPPPPGPAPGPGGGGCFNCPPCEVNSDCDGCCLDGGGCVSGSCKAF